jgi:hypothetical protein
MPGEVDGPEGAGADPLRRLGEGRSLHRLLVPPAGPASAARAAGGLALIAAVTLLWGVNWPAMKAAVGEVSPWLFRSVCVVLSSAG